ncbi:hypothetical protein [Klebsiella michiganensis]|nr:hypothetical protein [Klebsiella michiganensis]MBG8568625.1 hypothetical protein [Klebsiella michiganensis]HDX8828660.1 hypothetical protein [Klebsiella michiganensis]
MPVDDSKPAPAEKPKLLECVQKMENELHGMHQMLNIPDLRVESGSLIAH